MIISDLNYMEAAQKEVLGGFTTPIDYSAKIKFSTKIYSFVKLTPFSSSATAEADAAAAPYFIDGASTTTTSTVAAAGLAGGLALGAPYQVGSYSSSTSAAATYR